MISPRAERVYVVLDRQHAEELFPSAPEHVLARVEAHAREGRAVLLISRGTIAFDVLVVDNGRDLARRRVPPPFSSDADELP